MNDMEERANVLGCYHCRYRMIDFADVPTYGSSFGEVACYNIIGSKKTKCPYFKKEVNHD